MALEIHVLACDRHTNLAGENWLICYQLCPFYTYITHKRHNRYLIIVYSPLFSYIYTTIHQLFDINLGKEKNVV